MKQGWHRFHCTDGHTLVVDAHGVFVRSPDDLAAKAQRRVRGIMAAMPNGLDWSAWIVDVHDARGRHVAFVDFVERVGVDEVAEASALARPLVEPQ